MKVMIETESDKVYIDDKLVYSPETEKETVSLAKEIAKYRGETEYNGIVSTIQKWYYGYVSKTSWCATCISYFCNLIGKLEYIGGKAENVNVMRTKCKVQSQSGYGEYFEGKDIPKDLKRDDILFWLWNGTEMENESSKHVGVCEYDSSTNKVFCIGGNQKDKICTLEYDRKYLYAVYRMKAR